MATKPVLVAAPALFTTQEANGSTQKKLKYKLVNKESRNESNRGIKRHVSQGSLPSTPNNVNGRRMRRDFSDLVGASA